MARQLFISVLGTGLYEECKYTYTDENKNFTSSETNFIQKATIEYLCKDNKLCLLYTSPSPRDRG